MSPRSWDILQRGLQLSQGQTINRVIDMVGQINQDVNQRARDAIEAIGIVAAQRVEAQIRDLAGTVAFSINNNLNQVSQSFQDALADHLRRSGEQWSTQITQVTVDRVQNIGKIIDEKIGGILDAVADQVTEGSREMDTRPPLEPFKGRFKILNDSCRVLYLCGARVARIFRCIFLCNMNAGDRATRTRTACQNFLQWVFTFMAAFTMFRLSFSYRIISFGSVAIGGLILLLNRLQLPIRGAPIAPLEGTMPPPLPNTTIPRARMIEIMNALASVPAPEASNSTLFPASEGENSSIPLSGSKMSNSTVDSPEDVDHHVDVMPVTVNIRVEPRGPLPKGNQSRSFILLLC